MKEWYLCKYLKERTFYLGEQQCKCGSSRNGIEAIVASAKCHFLDYYCSYLTLVQEHSCLRTGCTMTTKGALQTSKLQAYPLTSTLICWKLMQLNLHLILEPWQGGPSYSLCYPMSSFRTWQMLPGRNRLMAHSCFIITIITGWCVETTRNVEISK